MKIIVIALLLIVAPASAEWTIETHRKGTNDSAIEDRLNRSEENSPTGRVLTVLLSRKLTPGRFGISYRIDNRPLLRTHPTDEPRARQHHVHGRSAADQQFKDNAGCDFPCS